MNNRKKIFAVASIGGHWIQLLRIAKPLEEKYDIVYLSSHPKCASMVEGHKFYVMDDFNRKNVWKLIPAFVKILKLVKKEKPKAVITTGAAPGLVCLLAGKLFGCKTIWIDSIANVEHLSASGRIARHVAARIYTQWPDLANKQILYAGNILK